MEPTNKLVNPMLTDFYQITMAYAYWKAGVHEEELYLTFSSAKSFSRRVRNLRRTRGEAQAVREFSFYR
jgi:nicotinic acid phosphoribosyltransferase